jgi:hypothetical protein
LVVLLSSFEINTELRAIRLSPSNMSITIQELDRTVRSFYEARGEEVGSAISGWLISFLSLKLMPLLYCSKNKPRPP